MGDSYQIVYRSRDPAEAEMLQDILRQDGIDARLLGTRTGALIGVPQFMFELKIETPEEQATRAKELIESILTNCTIIDEDYIELASDE